MIIHDSPRIARGRFANGNKYEKLFIAWTMEFIDNKKLLYIKTFPVMNDKDAAKSWKPIEEIAPEKQPVELSIVNANQDLGFGPIVSGHLPPITISSLAISFIFLLSPMITNTEYLEYQQELLPPIQEKINKTEDSNQLADAAPITV